jgi:hypothetical protein
MNDQTNQQFLLRYLAMKAKELYRENIGYRMFVERLKEMGITDVDEVLDTAKDNPQVESAATAFSQAIDSRLPPSPSSEDDAFVEWIRVQGLDRGPIH